MHFGQERDRAASFLLGRPRSAPSRDPQRRSRHGRARTEPTYRRATAPRGQAVRVTASAGARIGFALPAADGRGAIVVLVITTGADREDGRDWRAAPDRRSHSLRLRPASRCSGSSRRQRQSTATSSGVTTRGSAARATWWTWDRRGMHPFSSFLSDVPVKRGRRCSTDPRRSGTILKLSRASVAAQEGQAHNGLKQRWRANADERSEAAPSASVNRVAPSLAIPRSEKVMRRTLAASSQGSLQRSANRGRSRT